VNDSRTAGGEVIDLRSDTVTRPTRAMRQAMAEAPVGDDVYGEDPSVNALQERVAALTGKESALFVPSGTMGNLSALLAHCARGREVIVGDESHIYWYEAGGASALGGLIYHPVPTQSDGRLAPDDIVAAIRPSRGNAHFAPTGVVCLENTHNRRGGQAIPATAFPAMVSVAEAHGVPVHLDGARLFNASIALGTPIRAWCDHATSVQLCLSKSLGAPVGSVLAGSCDFIREAWRVRKMLGGGMRQAGVLAAACLVALDTMVERLAEDHVHAKYLAEELASVAGIAIDPSDVQTNIVIFEPPPVWGIEEFVAAAAGDGVLLTPFGGRRIRAMTHLDVSMDQCSQAVAVLSRLARDRSPVTGHQST
jgi:threonine aldolase